MYVYMCSKSWDGWNVLATFLIEAPSWFIWLSRRTFPLLHLLQDWCEPTCKQQWRCWSTVARLSLDLGLYSKCPESSIKDSKVSTWNVLNWAARVVTSMSLLNFELNFGSIFSIGCFCLFLNFYFLLEIWGGFTPPASVVLGILLKENWCWSVLGLEGIQEILIKSSWMDSSVSHLQLYIVSLSNFCSSD